MTLRPARLEKLAGGQIQHQIHRCLQVPSLDTHVAALRDEKITVRRQIEQDQIRPYLHRVNRLVELSALEMILEWI